MSRPKRINLSFCLYHVISRTNSDDTAFRDRKDNAKFLFYLAKYSDLFFFRVHAWCMMDTHFHLLLESGERDELSEMMRRLLTAYTVYFNRRHHRHGHLFQGRFKSYIVDKSSYLISLSRYIHLNPLETKSRLDPETFSGSSLQHYIRGNEPAFLCTKEILTFFDGNRGEYLKFIREGLNEETKPVIIRQAYIGSSEFVKRVNKRKNALEKKGSRERKRENKSEAQREEADAGKAEKILSKVAAHFEIEKELIQMSRHGRGDIGKARTALIYLLREFLPWNGGRIIRFVGLRSWSALSYHTTKEKIKSIEETINILKNELKDIRNI
jgi:REP element-mobilizing transposase RayT